MHGKGGTKFAYIINSDYEEPWRDGCGALENAISKKDDFLSDSSYGEGLIFGTTYYHPNEVGYYDKDWNLVISLEQYKENDISGGSFSDGYAPIVMTGADGDWYASIIDKQGNLSYTPIRIDNANPNDSANGYLQAAQFILPEWMTCLCLMGLHLVMSVTG